MNADIRTLVSLITLILMFTGMVFTAGQMWSKININTSAIETGRITDKITNINSRDIVILQTEIKHNEYIHNLMNDKISNQDKVIEKTKIRIRILEKKK